MKTYPLIAAALVFAYATAGLADDQPAAPALDPGDALPRVVNLPQGAPKEQYSFTVYSTWNAFDAMQSLIAHFENGRKSLPIHFMPFDSDQVIEGLGGHECDVAMPFDSFIPAADRKTADQCKKFPVGLFVIAVAVNASNPVRAMPMSDLRTAFAFNPRLDTAWPDDPPAKASTPWNSIGGSHSDMRIEGYRPGKFGPEGGFFQKRVLSGGPFADEFSRESIARHEKKSDAEIIDAIAGEAGAVGFFRCPFDKINGKNIRIIGIAKDTDSSPVSPSPATLAGGVGDYPLADTLTLYLRPDAPAEALEFCKFAAGPDGVAILKEYGFWPEYELKKLLGGRRLAAVKAGKGSPVSAVGPARGEKLVKELALKYVDEREAVQVHYRKQASQAAAARELLDGKAELMLLDGTPKTVLPEDVAAGLEKNCKRVVLGQTALGVVVNPNTLLTSLSIDELRQIFGGKIKNWEGGGKGAGPAIHGYGLPADQPVMGIYKKGLGAGGEGLGDGNGEQSLAGAAGSRNSGDTVLNS